MARKSFVASVASNLRLKGWPVPGQTIPNNLLLFGGASLRASGSVFLGPEAKGVGILLRIMPMNVIVAKKNRPYAAELDMNCLYAVASYIRTRTQLRVFFVGAIFVSFSFK
jgi:hypothetical protein